MGLGEVLLVLVHGDVEPGAGDDAAALDRILARLPQRHERVVALVVGEVEPGRPARRARAPASRAHSSSGTSERSSAARGGAIEAADAEVDRVHLAAADDAHHLVAELLQAQRDLDQVAAVARELDGAVVAEEVRRMQHRDVEHVALDPLAAVDEPPQRLHLVGQLDAADLLHRRGRARHVGDRADAADARGDVGRLRELPAAEERLEEARRLEDLELHLLELPVADADEHRPLALDAREVVGADLAGLTHGRGSPP